MDILDKIGEYLNEGSSDIIPIIVEIKEGHGPWKYCGPWKTKAQYGGKGMGRANASNLENYVIEYHKSLKSGGVNFHLSKSLGHIPFVNEARIKNQKTGEILATWKAGKFQVV